MGGKQKVVMRVPVSDDKSRSEALKTVAGVPGIVSASLEGADKNLVVVIGEGIDSVSLTKSLRKKLGDAELVTVASVEEKEEKPQQQKNPDNKDTGDNKNPIQVPWRNSPVHVIYVAEPVPPSSCYNSGLCSIL